MTTNLETQTDLFADLGFQDFDEIIESEKETTPQYLSRQGLRMGSRAMETIAGLPGDIQEFANNVVGLGLGAIGVSEDTIKAITEAPKVQKPTIEQLMAQGMPREQAEIVLRNMPDQPLGTRFPTSQELKEGMQQFDILKPQSEADERLDEFAEDVTALFAAGRMPFMKSLGTAFAAQAGGEITKAFGGGEKGKQLTKLGVIGLSSILDQPSVKKHIGKLYDKSRRAIPEGDLANAMDLKKDILNLRKEILKGASTDPEKAKPLALMNEMLKKIEAQGGKYIPADELVEFNKSINSRLKTMWLNPEGDVKRAEFWYLKNKDAIDKALNTYGNTNPAFLDTYKEANQAYQGMKRANALQKFISKKLNTARLSPDAKLLLGLHYINPKILAAGATQLTAGQAYNLAARYLENPAIRKIYNQTLKSAASKNAAALSRNVALLEKAIDKEKIKLESTK